MGRAARAAPLAAALALATLAGSALADNAEETRVSAAGGLAPKVLPRGGHAPAELTVGFDSSPPPDAPVPELAGIEFDLDSGIRFRRDQPSCPLTELYERKVRCPGSVVGRGSVASEITPPGGSPVAVRGRLVAFYNQSHRQPRILARVITGEPLPLTFVIPFSIKPAGDSYGRELVVRRMRRIVGKCTAEHPHCLAQPYSLKGVYGRISRLRMSLGASFGVGGEGRSFVEAGCPALPGTGSAIFSLIRTRLTYADGSSAEVRVSQACSVGG